MVSIHSTLEARHFPPYSPELNTQEHVWNNGRSAVTHNRFIPKIEPVTKGLVEYLNVTTFPYSLLDFKEQVRVLAVYMMLTKAEDAFGSR